MPKDDAEGSVRATIKGQNCVLLDWVAEQFGIDTPVSKDPRAASDAVNILLGRLRALGLPQNLFSINPWDVQTHLDADLNIQEFTSRPLGGSRSQSDQNGHSAPGTKSRTVAAKPKRSRSSADPVTQTLGIPESAPELPVSNGRSLSPVDEPEPSSEETPYEEEPGSDEGSALGELSSLFG